MSSLLVFDILSLTWCALCPLTLLYFKLQLYFCRNYLHLKPLLSVKSEVDVHNYIILIWRVKEIMSWWKYSCINRSSVLGLSFHRDYK